MSITITIVATDANHLAEQLATLAKLNPTAPTTDVEPATEKPKAERKPAAKKVDEPKAEETQPDTQDEKSDDSVPSLDDVKAAAQALVGANGREALAELLEKLGAKNLSTIAEGDRAKFIEQAKV